MKTAGPDGGEHPVARFAHFRFRQANQAETGQAAAGEFDLHFHGKGVHARKAARK